MSPGAKRSLITSSVLLGTAVVLVPLLNLVGRNAFTSWLGVAFLVAAGIWLIRQRKKFRTAFLVPLVCVPFLIGTHYSHEQGYDSPVALGAFLIGVLAFLVALIVDAFWSPYADDLIELEYRSAEDREN